MSETVQHEMLPEGESTARWAIRAPGVMGSVKQLLCCARCGDWLRGGPNTPRIFRDLCKPTIHCLCEDCNEALPD